MLPEGVDTVLLQEDCEVRDGYVAFSGPVKAHANTRKAGEDVEAGAVALQAGCKLAPQDLALLTATGHADVEVFAKLRVGVLSTGDELAPATPDAPADRTFDANHPMLLSLLASAGIT